MEARAAIPTTLPRSNPTVSYWQDPPDTISDLRSTESLPETADVVIVGSGISGASVAWNLLTRGAGGNGTKTKTGKDAEDGVNHKDTSEVGTGIGHAGGLKGPIARRGGAVPSNSARLAAGASSNTPRNGEVNQSIVMLEARQACSGATGRNGGHTKSGSYRTFSDNVKAFGLEQAIKVARLEYNNIKATRAFIKEHNIPCDLFTGPTVDIIYSEAQWSEALASIKLMRESMPHDIQCDKEGNVIFVGAAAYTIHNEEEARKRFFVKGTEKVFGAVEYEAGSLSAYKFVMGILKLSIEKGLNVQTNTPATSLSQDSATGLWKIETPRGIIHAKKVVLATNGYTAHLFPPLQSVIVPLRGQVTAQRPGLSLPKLDHTHSFIYEDGYEYMIFRPDNCEPKEQEQDIVIGGGLAKAKDGGLEEYGTTDDETCNSTISAYLRNCTERIYGESWGEDHKDGRIRKEWTGIMGYSPDGLPFVGEIPGTSNLFITASFQGHGMVLCFLCADALVGLMLEEREEVLEWFPEAFVITEERMRKRFVGRLHVKLEAEREVGTQ